MSKNQENKTIYDLKLDEEIVLEKFYVTSIYRRVPGGWIYWFKKEHPPTFIPYNEEFKECECDDD